MFNRKLKISGSRAIPVKQKMVFLRMCLSCSELRVDFYDCIKCECTYCSNCVRVSRSAMLYHNTLEIKGICVGCSNHSDEQVGR